MDEFSSPSDADKHYALGVTQKNDGHFDAALTSFRRVVIFNPKHFAAQFEIGLLCRDKARVDKTYGRYSLEAFRAAARLDPNHEDAQNQYINACQRMGQLDAALEEYRELAKKLPDNPVIQKCHKNLTALTMALMPQQVNVAGAQASGGIQKFALIASITLLLCGIALTFSPTFLLKSGKINKEQASGMVKLGGVFAIFGGAGIALRRKLG